MSQQSLRLNSQPDFAWVHEAIPRVLPASWHQVDSVEDGVKYRTDQGLSIIVSGQREQDGRRWLHVSLARPNQLPIWQEVTHVKDVVIGRQKHAIQVLPPESQYVNIHPYCLHLWSCVDGNPIPDFTWGGSVI